MQNLNEIIQNLDGKAVTLYSKLCGRFEKGGIVYHIRSVHGGQYKTAVVNIEIPCRRLWGNYVCPPHNHIPVCSHIMREFSIAAHIANSEMQQSEDNVQKGLFLVYNFGTRVLKNSVVSIQGDTIIISLSVRLPYNNSAYNTGVRADPTLGIKAQSGSMLAMSQKAQRDSFAKRQKGIISAKALKLLLTKNMPALVERFVSSFNTDALTKAVQLWENQQYIRAFLKREGYVAFIANGSVLPRLGKTDFKDAKGAVPFISPPSMALTMPLPCGKELVGMGIPQGITLITGDAYHGKSTILDALREGVYDHVLGDGREYVITDSTAMGIRSEDGRSIKDIDISFFLKQLPVTSISPQAFSTDNASGSTSQAAAVTEALESGCKLMLFDEDRCANNFMYKDETMRDVIPNASTSPFLDNATMFYEQYGISSVLVVGASGAYFKIAHHVILVDNFKVSEYKNTPTFTGNAHPYRPLPRMVDLSGIGNVCLKRQIEIKDDNTLRFGNETLHVADIIPHVTRGQLDFICSLIYHLTVFGTKGGTTLSHAVKQLYQKINVQNLCDFIK